MLKAINSDNSHMFSSRRNFHKETQWSD